MNHNNNFNIIRLILALFVVYSHSFGLLDLQEPTILSRTFGNFAVHCFFVISGYLVTLSYINSKNTLDFIYKRILRLIPAFMIAYLLGLVISSQFNNFTENPVPQIINGSLWTLSWELFAYILCAILGSLGLLKPNIFGSLWVVSYLAIVINVSNPSLTNQVIVPLLFLFLAGGFIALNEQNINIRSIGLISTFILIVVAIIPIIPFKLIHLLPWLYGPNFSYGIINYFLYLLLLPIAIIYIGKYLPFNLDIKNDVSYGVYIYAWPVQQTVIFMFIKSNYALNPLVVFVLSTIVTIFISFASWKLVEQPSLKLKKHYYLIEGIMLKNKG